MGAIGLPELFVLGVIALAVWSLVARRSVSGPHRYCQHCGAVGSPRRHTKGSFALELVLWLCFLLPGFIYSVWRLTSRTLVCGTCGAPDTIPTDSPKAVAALAKERPTA